MSVPLVSQLVGWVGWSVCHNFLKGVGSCHTRFDAWVAEKARIGTNRHEQTRIGMKLDRAPLCIYALCSDEAYMSKHHFRGFEMSVLSQEYISLGIFKRMSRRISQGSESGYGAPYWWRISLLPISNWSTQKGYPFIHPFRHPQGCVDFLRFRLWLICNQLNFLHGNLGTNVQCCTTCPIVPGTTSLCTNNYKPFSAE